MVCHFLTSVKMTSHPKLRVFRLLCFKAVTYTSTALHFTLDTLSGWKESVRGATFLTSFAIDQP